MPFRRIVGLLGLVLRNSVCPSLSLSICFCLSLSLCLSLCLSLKPEVDGFDDLSFRLHPDSDGEVLERRGRSSRCFFLQSVAFGSVDIVVINVGELRAETAKVGFKVLGVVVVHALADDGGKVFLLLLFLDELIEVVVVGGIVRPVARLPVVNVVRVNGLVLSFSTLEFVFGNAQLVNVLECSVKRSFFPFNKLRESILLIVTNAEHLEKKLT